MFWVASVYPPWGRLDFYSSSYTKFSIEICTKFSTIGRDDKYSSSCIKNPFSTKICLDRKNSASRVPYSKSLLSKLGMVGILVGMDVSSPECRGGKSSRF
jgi:hypothetical protein